MLATHTLCLLSCYGCNSDSDSFKIMCIIHIVKDLVVIYHTAIRVKIVISVISHELAASSKLYLQTTILSAI